MKDIIKLLYGLPRRIASIRQRELVLRKLHSENPDCTIMSHYIHASRFGKGNAILEGSTLYQVCMGDFSYVSKDSNLNNVEVGRFCSIGPRVQIGLAPHPSKVFVSTYPAFYSNENDGCPQSFQKDKIFDDSVRKTLVKNDVWIGSDVIIAGGISIGNGAIVAAGAVVVKDVPPYAVVGGNPAKVIRYRFSEGQIKLLLETKWWDWPIEKLQKHLADFSDVEKFLKAAIA